METLDTTGLRCPEPVIKLVIKSASVSPGEVLEIKGDCWTFEPDVRTWCQRHGKTVLSVAVGAENRKTIRIQF